MTLIVDTTTDNGCSCTQASDLPVEARDSVTDHAQLVEDAAAALPPHLQFSSEHARVPRQGAALCLHASPAV